MAGKLVIFVLFVLGATVRGAEQQQASAAKDQDGFGVNPIRRVVTMLQMMAKKVTAEGEKEEELFDKFMCYCETSGNDLKKSIEEAEAKVPELMSAIEEAEAEKKQLEEDLEKHRKDRADAKDAIATATAIREKEAAEFAKENAESNANIDALDRAIPAIEKGMGQVD